MIKVQEFHKDYKRWAWQINDNISYAEDIVLFKLDAKNTSYVFGATDDGYLIHAYYGKHPFISRGDGSGTHTKELALWPAELGITKEAESFAAYTEWYVSANTGMGACLVMAEEMEAYILTDKATFLTFQANGGVME